MAEMQQKLHYNLAEGEQHALNDRVGPWMVQDRVKHSQEVDIKAQEIHEFSVSTKVGFEHKCTTSRRLPKRPGLHHLISTALLSKDVDIRSRKIATEEELDMCRFLKASQSYRSAVST